MIVLLYIYIYIYIYICTCICIYINNIPLITNINRIYEHQNLLSLYFVSFLVGLRTYQHPSTYLIIPCLVPLELEILETTFVEKINTHFMFSALFFSKIVPFVRFCGKIL